MFLNRVDCPNKFKVHRGFSRDVAHEFKDNDMIYIDGKPRSGPDYVLEDAVPLRGRKLKVGGYLIFDDYGWGGPDMVKRGIDAFLSAFYKRIEVIAHEYQVFLRKLN